MQFCQKILIMVIFWGLIYWTFTVKFSSARALILGRRQEAGGQGCPKSQNPESGITGHCFTNTESKNYKTFIKANLRPKNVCLGLIRPKVSFYECFIVFTLCIGKTMTCDFGFRIPTFRTTRRPDVLSGCLPSRVRYFFLCFLFGLGYLRKPWAEEAQHNHSQKILETNKKSHSLYKLLTKWNTNWSVGIS